MPQGGFFGGFAQGFSSSFGQGMQNRRLSEQLGFEKQKFEWQKTQADREYELQRTQSDLQKQQFEQQKLYQGQTMGLAERQFGETQTQDQALREHQQYSDMLQAKRDEIAAETTKLNTVQTIQKTLFDTSLTKNQRSAALRSFALNIGMDLKSEQFKQLDLLTNDPEVTPEDRQQIGDLVTHELVNMPPAAVDFLVKQIKADPAKGMQIIKELKDKSTLGTPVKIIDPVTNQPRYEYPSTAVAQGLKPAAADPLVTMTNRTESTREQLFAQSEFERYNKEIRPQGEKANEENQTIAGLQAVQEGGHFKTGAGAGLRTLLGQTIELFGGDPTKVPGVGDPASAEIFNSLTHGMAVTGAQGLSRVTNLGIGLLQGSLPDMAKTPEGNAVLLEIRQRQNDRAIQIQHKADEYIHKYKTLSPDGLPSIDDFKDRLDATNPVINDSIRKKIESTTKTGAALTWDQALKMGGDALTEGKSLLQQGTDAAKGAIDQGKVYLDSPKFNSVGEAQRAFQSKKLKSGDVFIAPGADGKPHQYQVP